MSFHNNDRTSWFTLLRKMDKQAGKMIENSYKQGLDIGPIVFWEHPQYNDMVRRGKLELLWYYLQETIETQSFTENHRNLQSKLWIYEVT